MEDTQPEPRSRNRKYSHTPSIHEHDIGFEWNDDHEQLIKKWQTRAECYADMHQMAGKYYLQLHRWIGVPCKLILFTVGSIQFAQLSNSNDSEWSFYLTGFLAMAGFIIELGNSWLDFADMANKHFAASCIYDKLNMDIAMQLTHTREKRNNVKAFLRRARQILSDTKESVSEIPYHILDKFVHKQNALTELSQQPKYTAGTSNSTVDPSTADTANTNTATATITTLTATTTNPYIAFPLSTTATPNQHVTVNNLLSKSESERKDSSPKRPRRHIVDPANELNPGGGGFHDTTSNYVSFSGHASSSSQESISDIQDEFAMEMEKRMNARKKQAEEFQVSRINEH